MKKILHIVLSFLLVITTAACGSLQPDSIGIANPITEVTEQELLEQTGIIFSIPADANNVKYFTIATDPITAQMVFNWTDSEIICRVKSSDFPSDNGIEDISGFYYDWELIQEGTVNNLDCVYKLNPGKEGCVCWYDFVVGLLYNVSISSNSSIEKLQEIAEICCPLAQGDSYGDIGPINVFIGKGDNIIEDHLALSFDLDNNGLNETLNVTVENMDLDGCGNHSIYISTYSGEIISCDTVIWSKPKILLADINNDGFTEIFFVGDAASDDYVTYCWKFCENELIPICFYNENQLGNNYIDGAVIEISNNDIITIESFIYMLGTYGSQYHYYYDDNSFVPVDGDIFKFYEDEYGGIWIKTKVELIGYDKESNDQTIIIPANTELYFTGTNKVDEIYFKTRDGKSGALPISLNEQSLSYYICGIAEDDAFYNLPYAG